MLHRALQNTSINTKLKVVTTITLAGAMLLVLLGMLTYEYTTFRQDLLTEIKAQTSIIRSNSAAAMVFNDNEVAQEILSALQTTSDIRCAILYLNDGTPFANYSTPESDSHAIHNMPGWTGHQFGFRYLLLAEDVHHQGRVVGKIFVEASLNRLYSNILLFGLTMLLSGSLALALARLFLNRMTSAITQPISELTQIMQHVSATQNYSIRTNEDADDELGTLERGFNEMLSHIQKRDLELEVELSKRKQAEKRLDQLAYYDSVTNLPNRYFLNERLAAAIDNAVRINSTICLMFIDLDNFKSVNDSLGHSVGDLLLTEAGHRLKLALRTGDTVCRIGGDEFAVIIENVAAPSNVEKIAKNILSSISDSYHLDGNEIFLGASIGISICPNDATNSASLLRCADTAMYVAKGHGKNTYQYFSADMENRVFRKFSLGNSLRKALENNEFLLYYQAQTNIQNGHLYGFEALLRWQHPELGMVSPADFIPLAEETDLIIPIGEWVLSTACHQARAWQDKYHTDLTMCINLSGRQLRESNIAEKILKIVAETGFPPQRIELELTESVLMGNAALAIDRLAQLRSAGFLIAIDDFGTGYSSMSYLKRFSADCLKIDQSFVRGLPNDATDAAIVQATIALANSLKLTTVAEGVETQEQLSFLRHHGCHIAQGYLFSRPIPVEQAELLLHKKIQGPL